MANDAIRSLDSPVLDYFPEYRDLQTPERRKIRLPDLLSMTSGLRRVVPSRDIVIVTTAGPYNTRSRTA